MVTNLRSSQECCDDSAAPLHVLLESDGLVRKTIVPPWLLTESGFRPAAKFFWTRRDCTRPCADSR